MGLCPPDFRLNEGQRIKLNKAQQWLWATYQDLLEWAEKLEPFDLVLNGDLIEGIHHRTTEVIGADSADHFECAFETLSPLVEMASRTFVVRGTDTHTGPSTEHGLAKVWKAVPDVKMDRAAWDRLDMDMCGIRCRFVHHGVGTRREWTRASALNVDIASHQLASVYGGQVPPRVIGLGHFHHYAVYHDDRSLAFRTPSWQFHTRHTMKAVPWAQNQAGAVMLDWSDLDDGELPRIRSFIRRPNE